MTALRRAARDLFSIPASTAYLNAAYVGPSLRATTAAMAAGARRKAEPWTVTTDTFYDDAARARTLFADLIHGRSTEVALVPSASYGAAVAAANLLPHVRPSQNVVTLAQEHCSNRFVWQLGADRGRYENRVVPAPGRLPAGVSWTDTVLGSIDEATALVAVVPSFWTTGHTLDLLAVGRACRAVGAALVVDGTQSIGATAFDVREIQPDFVVCSGYKWLLCPYGVSFLWAAPKYAAAPDASTIEFHGWDTLDSGRGRATWGLPGGEELDTGRLDLSGSSEARRFDGGEVCALLPHQSVCANACTPAHTTRSQRALMLHTRAHRVHQRLWLAARRTLRLGSSAAIG